MDQMGEVDYAPGEPKGTPWHPHRGFETVTYMIDGTFQHQDSNGGGGLIGNGATQWMTAGKGILHIERATGKPRRQRRAVSRDPAVGEPAGQEKLIHPRYQGIGANDVVFVTSPDGGALVRVIAGNVAGHRGPGLDAHPDGPGARHRLLRGRACAAVAPDVQRVGLCPGRARQGGRPDGRPLRPASWPCSAPGDSLVLGADAAPGRTGRRASTCFILGGRRSASPSPPTGPS